MIQMYSLMRVNPGKDNLFDQEFNLQCLHTPHVQNDVLSLQFLNSALCGIVETLTIETRFPCIHKIVDPRIIQDRGDAFPLAQIGNRDLIVESLQHDPDFVFGGEWKTDGWFN
jgi:hypothetical protein